MNIFSRLERKQLNKVIAARLISSVLTLAIFSPQTALAAGEALPSQQLMAPVNAINSSNSAASELPTYAFSDTGAALAMPSVLTPTGKVEKKKQGSRFLAADLVIPTNGSPLVLEGQASYYSRAGCLGCNPLFVMANGQVLDDKALTMAIGADKVHLVGHTARVTNLANGKSVNVRITDTGGFYKEKYGNRVADLTIGTKQAIGMNGGLGQVRVEVY